MAQQLFLSKWQSRDTEPTEYELDLADALESAFSSGIDTLSGLVEWLNARGVVTPAGRDWTEASFAEAMRSLSKINI
jgi:hypothetical protein